MFAEEQAVAALLAPVFQRGKEIRAFESTRRLDAARGQNRGGDVDQGCGHAGANARVRRFRLSDTRRGRLDIGVAKCLSFNGVGLDETIGLEITRVLEKPALEASRAAWEEHQHDDDERTETMRMELAEAQYEAKRAFRQYNAVDPDNRLVASELEARWNASLHHAAQIEEKFESQKRENQTNPKPTWEEMRSLGKQVGAIWSDPQTDPRLKKRIARTLIEEIVVDTDPAEGWIEALIHWKGGIHTERRIKRRKRGCSAHHTAPETSEAITALVRIAPDPYIAALLNRNGLTTGRGNRWNRERVYSFRNKRSIAVFNEETRAREGWMNLTQAAAFLGISSLPLRKAAERGKLPAIHPLPNGPWIFKRSDLETKAARTFAEQTKQRRKGGALQSPGQLTLFKSDTYPEGVV